MADQINAIDIIICTYAPEEAVFSRCITAVSKLIIPEGIKTKIIVVDNNSPVRVEDLPYVKNVAEGNKLFNFVIEKKSGLTNARLAGLNNSTAPWLIYFDDDNEPREDYVIGALEAINGNERVGIWGPGNVEVSYTGPVSEWFMNNKRSFQEKHFEQEAFDNQKGWMRCYPSGTGQVINRNILNIYQDSVTKGLLTSKDRTGKSLASAGDVQIVYTALKSGYYVGVTPQLWITHIISTRKTTYRYMKRHAFGTSSSYPSAHIEIYPEDKDHISVPSRAEGVQALKQFVKAKLNGVNKIDAIISFSQQVGDLIGRFRAKGAPLTLFYNLLIKVFKLE